MKKIYLIAVIAALITAFAVYQFAGSIEENAKSKVEGAVDVVVATTKIDAHTILDEKMVETKQIAKELLGEGVASKKEDVIGKIVEYPLSKGEPIYTTRLSEVGKEDANQLSYVIPKGLRAVSMNVDNVSGVAGYIKEGDKVDLIAYYKDEVPPISKIALDNILVLKIGTDKENQTKGSQYTNITFALTPEQAMEFNSAIATAIVRLELRSPLG